MASKGQVADTYGGLSSGPRLSYTYEVQTGVPVDGTNSSLRNYSPFVMRLVVPTLVGVDSGVDVNLIGKAGSSTEDSNAAANQIRTSYGIPTVTSSSYQTPRIQAEYSAGASLSRTFSQIERAALVDSTTLSDIRNQIDWMLKVPPLTLLVNPNSMSVSYSSVQSFSDRSRKGFIFKRWGEEQVNISFSGSTGGFMAGSNVYNFSKTETDTPTGMQFASKRNSAAFQNFMNLYQVYRNNGYVRDTVNKSEAHLMVGAVAIDYDQMTYVGHIVSFDYSYKAETPHRLEWNMEFKVSRMYDGADSPVVVLPQYTPTPSQGSSTIREWTEALSNTPNQGTTANGWLSVTGTSQYAEAPIESFTPTGLIR